MLAARCVTALSRLDLTTYVAPAEDGEDAGAGEGFDAEQQRALARLDDVADQAREITRFWA
jgi:hypothetical protein